MVDALIHIHKQLKPAGLLIDIQPTDRYLPVYVKEAGTTPSLVGHVDVENMLPKYKAADDALNQTLKRGLYQITAQLKTDFCIYFDQVDACRQYLANEWTSAHLPETAWQKIEKLMQAEGRPKKIFFSEVVQFTRLSKTKK